MMTLMRREGRGTGGVGYPSQATEVGRRERRDGDGDGRDDKAMAGKREWRTGRQRRG